MAIAVKPQDKRALESVEFQLHPDIRTRLHEYAQSLDDSDLSYVLGAILEQALPLLGKAAKPASAKNSAKPMKRVREAA